MSYTKSLMSFWLWRQFDLIRFYLRLHILQLKTAISALRGLAKMIALRILRNFWFYPSVNYPKDSMKISLWLCSHLLQRRFLWISHKRIPFFLCSFHLNIEFYSWIKAIRISSTHQRRECLQQKNNLYRN